MAGYVLLEEFAENAKSQIDEVLEQCISALKETGIDLNDSKTYEDFSRRMEMCREESKSPAETILDCTARAISDRLKETKQYPCDADYDKENMKLTVVGTVYTGDRVYEPDKELFQKMSAQTSPLIKEIAGQCSDALEEAEELTRRTFSDIDEIAERVENYMDSENIPYTPDELADAYLLITVTELNDCHAEELDKISFDVGSDDGRHYLAVNGEPYQNGIIEEKMIEQHSEELEKQPDLK